MKITFAIILCCAVLIGSCQNNEVTEKKVPIELEGFSWKKPTWQGENESAYWFHGPIKAVKSCKVIGDGKIYPSGVWFDDLGYSLPWDENLRELMPGYLIFDQFGRFLELKSRLNLGYEEEDTSILSLNIDSIIHLLDSGLIQGGKKIYDRSFYNEMLSSYDEIQTKPRFLSALRFEAPFSLSLSNAGVAWKSKENQHNPPSNSPSGILYYHLFEEGKLIEKYSREGSYAVQNFSDTIFQKIALETVLIEPAQEDSYFFSAPEYATKDSLFDIFISVKTQYYYNHDDYITEKRYFWEIGMFQKDEYLYWPEGYHWIGYFWDSTHFAREVFVYDDFYRLDSHYVTINDPVKGPIARVESEKFYYTGLNTVPDSVFISKFSSAGADLKTQFLTTIFDEEGKVIENRYYSYENKTSLDQIFKVEYLAYDEYHNWTHRKIYYLPFDYNKPRWEEYRFMYEEFRKHEYYEE